MVRPTRGNIEAFLTKRAPAKSTRHSLSGCEPGAKTNNGEKVGCVLSD